MFLFQRTKEPLLFDELEKINVDFQMPSEFHTQIEMMELKEIDIKRLYCLKPIIENHVEALVYHFYDTIMKEPSLLAIIQEHSHVEKLRKTMKHHILGIFSGKVNQEYVSQRIRIAHIHVKIGLDTKWYINAFQQLLNAIIEIFHKEIPNREELYEAIRSLQKIFSLEQQLVLEAYESKSDELRNQQEEEKEGIRQQMRDTAHELSLIAKQTSTSLQDLVEQFRYIESLTDDGHQAMKKIGSLSAEGTSLLHEEKQSAEEIKYQIASLLKEINQLIAFARNIDKVVDVVSSIASQINLLALNASIESARAGEHGKGFAVVAEEIRNLSNLTKKSTEDIAQLVEEISKQMESVQISIQKFNQNIAKNKKMTEETIVFFNQIVEAMSQSKEKSEIVFQEIKKSDRVLNEINQATVEIIRTAELLNV